MNIPAPRGAVGYAPEQIPEFLGYLFGEKEANQIYTPVKVAQILRGLFANHTGEEGNKILADPNLWDSNLRWANDVLVANPDLLDAITSAYGGKPRSSTLSRDEWIKRLDAFINNSIHHMKDADKFYWHEYPKDHGAITNERNKMLAALIAQSDLVAGMGGGKKNGGFTNDALKHAGAAIARDPGVISQTLADAARHFSTESNWALIDTGTGLGNWDNDRDGVSTVHDIKRVAVDKESPSTVVGRAYIDAAHEGMNSPNLDAATKAKLSQIYNGSAAAELLSTVSGTNDRMVHVRNDEKIRTATTAAIATAFEDPKVLEYLNAKSQAILQHTLSPTMRHALYGTAHNHLMTVSGTKASDPADLVHRLMAKHGGNMVACMNEVENNMSVLRILGGTEKEAQITNLSNDIAECFRRTASILADDDSAEFKESFDLVARTGFHALNNKGGKSEMQYVNSMKEGLLYYRILEKTGGAVGKYLDSVDKFNAYLKITPSIPPGAKSHLLDMYKKGTFHQLHALYGAASTMTLVMKKGPLTDNDKQALAASVLSTTSNALEGYYKHKGGKDWFKNFDTYDENAQTTFGTKVSDLDIGMSTMFKVLSGAADGLNTFKDAVSAAKAFKAGDTTMGGLYAAQAGASGISALGAGMEIAGLVGGRFLAMAGPRLAAFLATAGGRLGALGAIAGQVIGAGIEIAQGIRTQKQLEDFEDSAHPVFDSPGFGDYRVPGENGQTIRERYFQLMGSTIWPAPIT